MNGGMGNDSFDYTVSNGKDDVRMAGGSGVDNANIRIGADDVVTVYGADGKVVFSQGEGEGTAIRLDGMETYQFLGEDGKVLGGRESYKTRRGTRYRAINPGE